MKKLVLSFITVFSVLFIQAQTCTPDPNLNKIGIFPPGATNWDSVAVMPIATAGMMYDQTAQMLAPADTVIDTVIGGSPIQITVTIDSLWLFDFAGLPPSLSVTCNTPDCFMEGGDRACMRFLGTPTLSDVGTYLVQVKADGIVSSAIGQLRDTIVFLMQVEVQATQSVEENVLARTIQVTPNPIRETGHVTFEVPDAKDYTFEIIDLTGKKIQSISGTSRAGVNSIRIDRNQLSEGLYFYAIRWNGISHKGRMMFVD